MNLVLGGCLGVCLLALGFLLGRESNRAPATLVAAPAAGVAATEAAPAVASLPAVALSDSPTPAAPPEAAPPAVVARPRTSTLSLRASPASTPPASPLPAKVSPAKTAPEAAGDAAEREAVAHYFREVDRLQNVDIANPEASASALIGAATSGDTSGFRALVSQARDAEQNVRAVTPPPACAHYHGQLLNMLAESRSMLQRLEKGIAGGDSESLPALLSQATSAKSRSEALANEARDIKRRHGIAP